MLKNRSLFLSVICGAVLFTIFCMPSTSCAEKPFILKADNLIIPYPMEGYKEIFVDNRNNAKFKQINFDDTLRLYFIVDTQADSFLKDSEFSPDLGLKVNVRQVESNKEEFSKFAKSLEDVFFNAIPQNIAIEDVYLGRACSVKNMFPIKVRSTKHSVTCLWLIEYGVANKEESRVETKNYYCATHAIYIKGKMVTFSAFIDLSNEIDSEALQASLISWGLATTEANK